MKKQIPLKYILCVLTLTASIMSTAFLSQNNGQAGNSYGSNSKARTFAIVYPVLHPFFESVTRGAEKQAYDTGIRLIVKGPDIDNLQINQQIEIMNKLIDEKVDGIAIGPTDSASLLPIINKAINRGIKVICFDTDSPQSKRISYIGTNNIEAGKHMGEVLAKLLSGKGKIICSMGLASQLNLIQRITGIKMILKKYPEMKLLEIRPNMGDPDVAVRNIEEMTTKHPDFDALIGMDSLSGPAGITVWKAKGLRKIFLTFDNMPEILDGIGYGQITASISQNQYKWGELIIKNLNAACDGRKLQKLIYTKTTEINKSNIEAIDKSLLE